MEHFTNERIDTATLPRFEDIQLTPLQPAYRKVIFLNISIAYLIAAAVMAAGFFFVEKLPDRYWYALSGLYAAALVITIVVCIISFRNRGFAFRTHDVLYRSGAIAINTTIIPYSRIQHVALHEGLISRKLSLASIEIYTAGGVKSDIRVAGLLKDDAERIRHLLMGKISNPVQDGE